MNETDLYLLMNEWRKRFIKLNYKIIIIIFQYLFTHSHNLFLEDLIVEFNFDLLLLFDKPVLYIDIVLL